MRTRRHSLIKNLRFLGVYLCLKCAICAAPSGLESNSPFLPPGYGTLKPALPKPIQNNGALAKDLEFRGVVQLDGVYQFSFFKKSENRGYWVAEGQSENGISVDSFSADSMQVTVTSNGRTEKLDLMAASESPLPVVASAPFGPAARPPTLPAGLPQNVQSPNRAQNNQPKRRTIPRRRVILPPKK